MKVQCGKHSPSPLTRLEVVSRTIPNHIVVVGQGYVGLPVSMAAVKGGNRVTGIDLDNRKIALLLSGVSPVDDVPSHEIKSGLERGVFAPSTNYADAANFDFAVITVPTPLKGGEPDLTFIESAGESIARYLRKGATVVLESTTYPGTTEELLRPILEKGSGLVAGKDFFLGYSPERIDPGNPTWNLLNTPKVVSGIDSESQERVRTFYESLGIPTVVVSGTREAEMTKLLENTFRHVNIALVNELAKFSKQLGVNIWEAIEAASTKPFGFMKFTPGPGVGGHCLPIDPTYLSWAIKDKSGFDFSFVSLANKVNSSMPEFVAKRAAQILDEVNGGNAGLAGAKTLIVGLAYKAGTGDIRESPSLGLANILSAHGAQVEGVDSLVPDELWPPNVVRADPESNPLYDLAIVITNHSNGKDDWGLSRSAIILDTRNSLDWPDVIKL